MDTKLGVLAVTIQIVVLPDENFSGALTREPFRPPAAKDGWRLRPDETTKDGQRCKST